MVHQQIFLLMQWYRRGRGQPHAHSIFEVCQVFGLFWCFDQLRQFLNEPRVRCTPQQAKELPLLWGEALLVILHTRWGDYDKDLEDLLKVEKEPNMINCLLDFSLEVRLLVSITLQLLTDLQLVFQLLKQLKEWAFYLGQGSFDFYPRQDRHLLSRLLL